MKTSTGSAIAIIMGLGCLTHSQVQSQCYRDTDCDSDRMCIDRVCTTPENPLVPCETADTCEEDIDRCDTAWQLCREVCDDGYCKKDAVYCQNTAGFCYIGALEISCSCSYSGGLSGASGGMAPSSEASETEEVPVVTDEELYEECQLSLVDLCGEKAPDIHDLCTDEEIEFCTEAIEYVHPFAIKCGRMDEEEAEQDAPQMIQSCCEMISERREEYEKVFKCIKALDSDDCDGFEDCIPEDSDDSGTSSDSVDEIQTPAAGHRVLASPDAGSQEENIDGDASDDKDSGCSVGLRTTKGSSGALQSLILLMSSLFVTMRRHL